MSSLVWGSVTVRRALAMETRALEESGIVDVKSVEW